MNLGKKKDQVFPRSVLCLNQVNSQSFPNPLNLLNLLVCHLPSPYLIIDCYFVRSRYSNRFWLIDFQILRVTSRRSVILYLRFSFEGLNLTW